MIGEAYRLKMIPYGPAGIELIPNGFRKMMHAIDNIVETIDETRMNDWNQFSSNRLYHGPPSIYVAQTTC
jgi:hypothetical protein